MFTVVLKYSIFLIFKLRTDLLASYEILGLFVTKVSATLLENLADDAIAYYVALCDKLFDNFPLFDETFYFSSQAS